VTKFHLNVLAANLENAKAVAEAGDGKVLVGVIVKDFPTVESAIEMVRAYQREGVKVSVGLGGGNADAWKMVHEVALGTNPAHVNQVFPASGYTMGGLHAKGYRETIVNALIRPTGIPGKVIICTGPKSERYAQAVSCDAAAAMLAEVGIPSVKFFPIEGDKRLDEVAEMVRAAVRHGVHVFEPTGGINLENFDRVVDVCVSNGAAHVIPHVYSSIIDKSTGLTRVDDVRKLVRRLG
jgi:2-dehydro-3-deoxy-phosphogluconate aldolase